MIVERTLKLAIVLVGLFALSLLGPHLFTDRSYGQDAMVGRPTVKYVVSVDYPVDGKDRYVAWVRSVAEDLKAPAEVRRITSYDDYFGESPQRVVEFEFDSIEDAGRYFGNEKVRAVFEKVPDYGLNAKVQMLLLRSDYTPK